jgi:hypothetical protein
MRTRKMEKKNIKDFKINKNPYIDKGELHINKILGYKD